MRTIPDLIKLWPTQRQFAVDLGVPETTVSSWKLRGSIPPKYWQRIIQAAESEIEQPLSVSKLAALTIGEGV